MKPTLSSSFVYEGQTILVDWYEVTKKQNIPDLDWQQVYAIGSIDGQVPLVTNKGAEKPYNLPGGKVEPGETIEQTLKRELIEECNMRVMSWQPLGYQILTEPDGRKVAQFRVYAEFEKIAEFVSDPAGSVVKNTLVGIDQVNQLIDYGDVGEEMIKLAKSYF